jgi:fibronectin-binding autotransporter adhesin
MAAKSRRRKWIMPALAAAVALAATTSWADITPSGDVSPDDPSTWTGATTGIIGDTSVGSVMVNNGSALLSSSGYLALDAGATGTATVDGTGSTWICGSSLYVGNSGTGTLNISNGGSVSNSFGYLGFKGTGSAGTVLVDGSGSTWTCSDNLYVGISGTGTLHITNGGLVVVGGGTYLGNATNTAGSIHFGVSGGTLTTRLLYGGPAQFTGVGTLNTRGLVSDGDLVFDATHGLDQTLDWVSTQGNVTVHLDLTGGSGAVGDLGAGYQGAGTLTLRDGATVNCASGVLGYQGGSAGVATVEGGGSTWTCSNDLYVGRSGTGTLNITNGGSVRNSDAYLGSNSTGSAGTVVVDGSGSTWTGDSLYAGYSRTGTLTISNGGRVSNSSGYLGYSGTGSAGTVLVTGSGSTWTCSSYLYVGYSGTGALNITNGGSVSNSSGYLGYGGTGSAGTALVDGSGSTWTCSNDLYVGNSGTGTLNITNGGQVSSTLGVLGYNSGSAGTVLVDGSGSIWTCGGSVTIGRSGAGTLSITNGGLVTVGGTTYLGGAGRLSIGSGSTMVSDGVLGTSGGVWIIGGTQTIRSSGTTGAYYNFATGQSSSALSGTSKIAGANLTITGTLDLKNNALIVEAADSTSKATLLATLAGQLGTQITSSSATTNSHYTMSLIDNATLGATMFGGLAVDANSLIVTEALKGDADLDGGVGPLDVAIWKADFGVGQYATTDGDFDLDGGVGPLDLALWKANFGASVLSDPAPSDASTGGLITLSTAAYGSGVIPVPEPVSLLVLVFGTTGLLTRRRRRAHCGETWHLSR